MLKKVSLIIPVYNAEKYIERALLSALHQSYKNLEIIIIDDGSSDRTLEICKTYASEFDNVSYYRQNNKGVSAARNLGIRKATGEYVVFLDSDDTIDTDVIKNLIKNYKSNELVSVRPIYEDAEGGRELPRKGVYDTKNLIREIMSDNLQGFVWGFIFKKEECVCFDERVNYCEDIVFMINYIKHNNIKTIRFLDGDSGCYHYLYNADGITKSKKNPHKTMKEIDVAMGAIRRLVNANEKSLVDNRECELFEAIMSSIKDKKILDNIINTINLPNYQGGSIRIGYFANLYHRKNVKKIAIYYIIRNKIKQLANLVHANRGKA